MSYIGNGKSLIVIGSNAKDDLIPDGTKTVFQLSQEVPGGYESNITVLKQQYVVDELLVNNTNVSIANGTPTGSNVLAKKVSTTSAVVASTLSKVKVGDNLHVSAAGTYFDGKKFKIVDVTYNGSSIDIYIQIDLSGTSASVLQGQVLSLSVGYYKEWNILEPEIDYVVTANGKNIQLTVTPTIDDKLYVLHKGEATYNFVPTVRSVGPEHLSENLRNFQCDRYTGTGTTTTFALGGTNSGEYTISDPKSLLVTVGDKFYDSDSVGFTGSWQLDSAVDAQGNQTITFHSAPAGGTKIRILHLAFSTVSRRAAYAAGQVPYVPGQGSVGTDAVQNLSVTGIKISDGAISANKLSDGAVTSRKILLSNNEALKGQTHTSGEVDVLKIGSDNSTILNAQAETVFSVAGQNKISIDAGAIKAKDAQVSIGTPTDKFNNIFIHGQITAASGVFTGNVTASAYNDINITALKQTVDSIPVKHGAPIGSIVMWPSGSDIPKNWKRCDGGSLSTYAYQKLHQVISNTFGGSQYVAGTTNLASATTTFKLPDMVTRFPVGASVDATNIGNTEGETNQNARSIQHTHQSPDHTHTFEHTHFTPGHYHATGGTTGTTLNVSTSGSHKTDITHTHNNSRRDLTDVVVDRIDVSGGNHTHTGETALCGSLEHVHRSWPVINKDTAGSVSAVWDGASSVHPRPQTANTLGGPQWKENRTENDTTDIATDLMPTGYVRTNDVNTLNDHTHAISSSGNNPALSHTHSIVDYVLDANIGNYTVASGVVDSTSAVKRFSGIVAEDTAKLNEHAHRVPKFYTDFPYVRVSSDLPTTGAANTFHTDLGNRRTSLQHTHTFTTDSDNHTHTLSIVYKNESALGGEHTHAAGTFSGSLGQVSTVDITNATTLNKLGAITAGRSATIQTGGYNGNTNIETSGVSKVNSGGTWTEAKSSTPIYAALNQTSAASSAYLVLNFIIKVSDDEV